MESLIAFSIVGAASLYLAHRVWRRRLRRASSAGCTSGCDSCPVVKDICRDLRHRPRAAGLRLAPVVVWALPFTAVPASAADTVETFDPQAADMELYLGFDGRGPDRQRRAISGHVL